MYDYPLSLGTDSFSNGSILAAFDRYKAIRILKSDRLALRVVSWNCGSEAGFLNQWRSILGINLVYEIVVVLPEVISVGTNLGTAFLIFS